MEEPQKQTGIDSDLILKTRLSMRRNPFVLNKAPKSGKKKDGRPSAVTQGVVKKLEEAFLYDCTVKEACCHAGIARQTYYSFVAENPDFLDRIDTIRSAYLLIARRTVVQGLENNPRLAFKYLEWKGEL